MLGVSHASCSWPPGLDRQACFSGPVGRGRPGIPAYLRTGPPDQPSITAPAPGVAALGGAWSSPAFGPSLGEVGAWYAGSGNDVAAQQIVQADPASLFLLSWRRLVLFRPPAVAAAGRLNSSVGWLRAHRSVARREWAARRVLRILPAAGWAFSGGLVSVDLSG